MSPLTAEELKELATRILSVHGIAYDWEPDLMMKMSELKTMVASTASIQVQDRARQTIKEIVRYLVNTWRIRMSNRDLWTGQSPVHFMVSSQLLRPVQEDAIEHISSG
jgi:hypothetical protein